MALPHAPPAVAAARDVYEQAVTALGLDPAADRAAAQRLHDLLAVCSPGDRFREVGTELKHRPRAVVLGCGPSLEALTAADLPQGVVVAADGAALWCREQGIVPRVVVTDLDGHPDGLSWAAAHGAAMVVHAHGDNVDRFDLVPGLGPLVAGTYQGPVGEALHPMRDLGGFTDGDRAVLLCAAFGVKEVVLAGFDLDAPPGRYSHETDAARKAVKLGLARQVLEAAAQAPGPRVVSL